MITVYMKNNASFLYSLFLVISDLGAIVLAYVSGYILRVSLTNGAKPLAHPVPARTYILILISLIPIWLIIFALIGLYNRSIYEKRFSELGRLFIGTVIGSLLLIGVAYFSNDPIFPAKLVPIYAFLLTFVLLVISRNLARLIRRLLFSYNIGISNVLIVGDTDATKELVSWLSEPKVSGYNIVGIVGSKVAKGKHRHYASFESAVKAIGASRIHSVMQTELYTQPEKNNEILTFAQNNHAAYRFIPGNSELFVGNIDVELFQSSIPVIAVHQTALIGWGRIAKRLFDSAVALVAIIILAPLYLLIGVAVFVFDPGAILFKQERITRYNTRFTILKFRTLKKKYNGLTPEEGFSKMGRPDLAKTFRENGDQLDNDPRFNVIGRFLRKFSLDELPQLFNVLKGDISLVGPRAIVAEELEEAQAKHHILSVKSGITGLAQISGRKDISREERRKLDLYYVQNWNFWFDITILFKTLRVIFTKKAQ